MIPSVKCTKSALVVILLIASTAIVTSFQLYRSTQAIGYKPLALNPKMDTRPYEASPLIASLILLHNEIPKFSEGSDNVDEDAIVGERYEGSVDWDAEWKKVVENRDQPTQRPGKYRSQAEIVAIKATNKVAKNVFEASQDMKAKLPKAPSIRSLQGDWRVSWPEFNLS